MAKLERGTVLKPKPEMLTIREYGAKYNNVTPQGIAYAIEKGHIDYAQFGREKFIVMTEHTKLYVPNGSPAREKKKKALEKKAKRSRIKS